MNREVFFGFPPYFRRGDFSGTLPSAGSSREYYYLAGVSENILVPRQEFFIAPGKSMRLEYGDDSFPGKIQAERLKYSSGLYIGRTETVVDRNFTLGIFQLYSPFYAGEFSDRFGENRRRHFLVF